MFSMDGIETEDLAQDGVLDEPLSMRNTRRRLSSVSGASNDDEGSNSYSSASCTTGSGEDSSDAMIINSGKRNDALPDLAKMTPSATIVNLQNNITMSPITFTVHPMNNDHQILYQQVGSKSKQAKNDNGNKTRGKKKHRRDGTTAYSFSELYYLTDESLGSGSYATVRTCLNRTSGVEYAVKIIEKCPAHSRTRVIKEIETFHLCTGHPNIVQLVEYFEEDNKFFLIFEKMHGGPLLNHIQRRICFTEHEACLVVRDIAHALKFLHDRGIAHRDLKPENILCTYPDRVSPVKLCDLDLASKAVIHDPSTDVTPELQSPVGSAEFMAPEVVDAFVGEALSYDKRCDLWSLGVILYIMLCGYPPFYGECEMEDCGWDRGLPCQDCQDSLFSRIQKGEYDFPEEDWAHISGRAKDLIRHLLVKDASRRYTVDDVLRHDWLQIQAPKTPLMTPDVLMRNDSARDLAQLAGHFDAVSRMGWHQRLSNNLSLADETQNLTVVGPNTIGCGAGGTISRKLTPVEQFRGLTLLHDRHFGSQQQQQQQQQ